MFSLRVNGAVHAVEADADTPLLWVLRENLKLSGTKFGCGIAQCGACTVHIDGVATRSCITPIAAVGERAVTTIEGLKAADGTLHAVQQTWLDEQVPQCGYCQSGQLMSASALLATHASPSDEDIDEAMKGNVCRCGTYSRIRSAIHRAASTLASNAAAAPLPAAPVTTEVHPAVKATHAKKKRS